MKSKRAITRRDLCDIVGRRANALSDRDAGFAWFNLAGRIESLAFKDVPKFKDLIDAIRAATIRQKKGGATRA